MKPPKIESNSVVILYPPLVAVSPLSNKYATVLNVKWGEYTKEISVSREHGSYIYSLVEEVNKALLEASETKPYLIK